MDNITARSEGFILPILLILMLILSLVLMTLYQVEEKHLLIYRAVKMDAAMHDALPDLQNKILADAQKASFIQPDPSNTPQENKIYLRALDAKTGEAIWQEKRDGYQVLIDCDVFKHCKIQRIQRVS